MSLIKDIRYNIQRTCEYDPCVHSQWEVLFLYPHIKALILHRISHWYWCHHWFFLARLNATLARNMTGIEIHPGAEIGRGLVIDHGMGVVIGETAQIGDDCVIYHGVTLGGTGKQHAKRHPTIGDHVCIGAGAKLLGSIVIGSHSKIGANAVVLHDCPPSSVMVGVPAINKCNRGSGMEQTNSIVHKGK